MLCLPNISAMLPARGEEMLTASSLLSSLLFEDREVVTIGTPCFLLKTIKGKRNHFLPKVVK